MDFANVQNHPYLHDRCYEQTMDIDQYKLHLCVFCKKIKSRKKVEKMRKKKSSPWRKFDICKIWHVYIYNILMVERDQKTNHFQKHDVL